MKKRFGLVITGGAAPEKGPRLEDRENWMVIAADSGLHHADRYAIRPDLIVGDFDSLDRSLLREDYSSVPQERFETAKDYTDTEIALQYLWKSEREHSTLVGGGGGRLDHLLGLAALFQRVQYPNRWLTDTADALVIDASVEFVTVGGETVSFFPVGADVCRMKSEGLRWNLNDLEWRQGDAGISNEFTGDRCRIEMLSGRLLMVRALQSPVVLPWNIESMDWRGRFRTANGKHFWSGLPAASASRKPDGKK